MRLLLAVLIAAPLLGDGFPARWFFTAHNCYPQSGQGADRLERARQAGLSAFELDLVWSEARRRTVITHETKLDGSEPALEDYFFRPMLPELRGLPPEQPAYLLILDFKTGDPRPVREVYGLLGRHRSLLTTSGRQFRWRPLTVLLTGNNDAIAAFEKLSPGDQPYLAIANREPAGRQFQENPADYFTEPATPFYKVFNFAWTHVERDPNPKALDFTEGERGRLAALVAKAREKGYWTRFWTLNAASRAWGESQNFGSVEALLDRWRAAALAGVDMIATDEYELAAQGAALLR